LIDDVLVSLSIYHSIEASNLCVFGSVLDEALDFLLAILEITAATFQLKSQVRITITTATTIVTAPVRDYNAIAGTFYFYSPNCILLLP
jgi:hypothetical protein